MEPSCDLTTSSSARRMRSASSPFSSSAASARFTAASSAISRYSACFWAFTQSTTSDTSASLTQAPCTRRACGSRAVMTSMSPIPISFSAPTESMITRESVWEATANASRLGMLALITPVITLTEGRWVAITRWIPTARAIWARRTTALSTSRPATIMRSFSSSISTTR